MAKEKSKKKLKWYIKLLIAVGCMVVIFALLLVGALSCLSFEDIKPYYTQLKLQSYEREFESAEKGQVVFLGDSITDYCDLALYYPQFTCYNRGISGDATYDLLDRMDSVCELEPSVVVLLIGINDFMNESRSVEDTAADYERVLSALKENLPDTKVLCQSVYPGYDGKCLLAEWQDEVLALNSSIEALAEEYGYTYVDVYPHLLDGASGEASHEYISDGCHPTAAGYEVISAVLTPYIEEAYNG